MVAVRDDRLQRRVVGLRLGRLEPELRRDAPDLREPERGQRADVGPAQVELVPARRELRRRAVRVVIVVELLAADQDADRDDVGRRVVRRVVAVAPVVTDAVDDAGGPERDPRHLHRPDRRADRPEQREVDREHEADPLPRVARVDVALEPVVRRPVAVALDRLRVARLGAVELGAAPDDRLDSAGHRAVRIVLGLDLRVVLAVDRRPLLRDHPGREPQPEPEEVRDRRMQIERAVRLAPVQEDRDGRDRDVRERERHDDVAPPGEGHEAVGQEVEERIEVGHSLRRRRGPAGVGAKEPLYPAPAVRPAVAGPGPGLGGVCQVADIKVLFPRPAPPGCRRTPGCP